jgi:uncharacterized protein DUF4258
VTENQDAWREITVGGKPRAKFVLDPHAQKRARQRCVSDSEINETLTACDVEVPAEHGRRNRYKVIGGHRIRVTFHRECDDIYYVWTVTKDEVAKK